jgi:hypothetical protein
MVADVEAVTDGVVIVKFALVAPDATVTLAGAVATAVLLLVRVTTAPPDGAALVSLTVPFDAAPPATLVGLTESDDSEAGGGGVVTVNPAARLTPLYAPLIVAEVDEVTEIVPTVNVAFVAPAATVTLAGTVAAGLLLVSVTTAPPESAALVRLNVPCDAVPPTTLVGVTDSEESVGAAGAPGVTVRTAAHVVFSCA